jgi:hypothetical protein
VGTIFAVKDFSITTRLALGSTIKKLGDIEQISRTDDAENPIFRCGQHAALSSSKTALHLLDLPAKSTTYTATGSTQQMPVDAVWVQFGCNLHRKHEGPDQKIEAISPLLCLRVFARQLIQQLRQHIIIDVVYELRDDPEPFTARWAPGNGRTLRCEVAQVVPRNLRLECPE